MSTIDTYIIERAKKWLEGNYDRETKEKVKALIDSQSTELVDSFYRDLEFGTGGLRGIMGVGTNRMNKYTVGMATQGLANYMKKMFPDKDQISMAIAFDSRNNNTFFAGITADVMSANGIKVYVFEDLRPTPELSFAIRHLGCQAGVVITASHNPPEYNGYKAYWEDGGQLISPHDKNVIDEVNKITSIDHVKFDRNESLVETIGEAIDKVYLDNIRSLSLSPDVIARQSEFKIVYTPIHGTGVELVPKGLKAFGFKNIYSVPEQDVIDGNFPTVKSPNPEEPAALNMAIEKAKAVGANLVMATDPDADRVGIAVLDDKGDFVLLNGNQTATLLLYYLLKEWKDSGKLTGREYIVKTIVTSEILKDIAIKNGVESLDVLTGFKYIAEQLRLREGKKTFIGGGEESYGYLVGDFVRDKDAVISCCMIAETAAWAADQDKTLYELLPEIYVEFGFYKETLKSVVRKGKAGAEEIQQMMDDYRTAPPVYINSSKLITVKDYQLQIEKDIVNGTEKHIDLPKSNVLQFFLEDGSKISVRPSGTEPKIKFYFSVKAVLENVANFKEVNSFLDSRIKGIIEDLKL
ncbi:MAG: phospho-sugar mutase [Bacteroidales bacterium]|nr:phospho-sugar mutase [Bacteroidales bacterium]MCF8403962.1 phospho-sugar mutase [Bacteroidales bacterium]